ncbi:hypothetical protein F442_23167 [Phytophthora nicotianae P10297]|uniref:Uncharacterized protein n=1 Tax=Phytophthora nicotianae P10297 TaxID=1317064 RepID=W2XXW3_PHYNI|nr:hypothetical protein F442_23167 [Phytophthora nicotianae P10297]
MKGIDPGRGGAGWDICPGCERRLEGGNRKDELLGTSWQRSRGHRSVGSDHSAEERLVGVPR